MNKPDGLKRLLLAAVPALAADPARLSMFVDKGRIAASAKPGLHFEYRYTLNIVVQDYAGEMDALFVPILAWVAEQQPELLENNHHEPFTFDAELMDANSADVSIDLQLSEGVLVTPRQGGGFDASHLDEPQNLDCFPDIGCQPLWQVFLRDQLIASSTDPVFVSAP